MGRPRSGGDKERPDEGIEGPIEDARSVLGEPVDLAHSLLDEAELGTEELPPALAENAEIELDALQGEALDAESMLAPPQRDDSGEDMEPEQFEARLEEATEPAEMLSLHDEDSFSKALLDEGAALDVFDVDTIEDEVERRFEQGGEDETAPRVETPVRERTARPAARRRFVEGEFDTARFRHLLLAERSRLLNLEAEIEKEGLRQRSEQEDLSALSAIDQHPADQGTETFDRERDLSIRDQVEGELAEVERALGRLEAGTYGRCEACGRPISADRLVAEPAARLCLEDQRELERELALKHREVEL